MDQKDQRKRYAELAELSRRKGIYQYTDFLAPADAEEALRAAPASACRAFGGAENCERVMIRYGNPGELGYEETFPIVVLRIHPRGVKFAESLTHRDFLGALMHLGVKREVIGDILVRGAEACVMVEESLADYLCQELDRVRHTTVICERAEELPRAMQPQLQKETITAASLRLDLVIAKTFHLSRTRVRELFAAGAVSVGGRICEKESYTPREGDRISVRGFGKFRFAGENGTTKKGSLLLQIEKYC